MLDADFGNNGFNNVDCMFLSVFKRFFDN